MRNKLANTFFLLSISLLFTACQNKEKAMADSFSKLVDVVRFNGLEYQLQYEPHLVKSRKRNEGNSSADQKQNDAEQFRGHHYLTLSIDGLNQGLAGDQRDNYEVLSEYLKEEYKNRFSLMVNGARKDCVLHHALFLPQNRHKVLVQLVFKDADFANQTNYFQDDISVIYFDKKNKEKISWSFSAHDLNQFPALNNNYNNG